MARQAECRKLGANEQGGQGGRLFYVHDLLDVSWWRGQDLNLRPLGYEPESGPGAIMRDMSPSGRNACGTGRFWHRDDCPITD